MNYHFIAIGGAVMHNLALEIQALGNTVTGSDDDIFEPAYSRLKKAGLLPEKMGWFAEKVKPADAIILGMHARKDNPELQEAIRLNKKIFSFPDFIFEHSQIKKRIVIGGSHGKTTSTAMLMHVLNYYHIDHDYLVGSQLPGYDRMVKLSGAPLIVIEGDEYLTSSLDPVPKFHKYHPHLAMITGIAWDHINVFPTFENYIEQFEIFIKQIEPAGICFYFNHDLELQKLSNEYHILEPYSCVDYETTTEGTEIHIENERFQLQIFGKHNLENASGIQKLAEQLGISKMDFWRAMESFTGTAKRLEKWREEENFIFYRDFAHAPSKARASVNAIAEKYPNEFKLSIFELHTYSSLRLDFMHHYKGCFDNADESIVFFDEHVFELKKMPKPSAEELAEIFPNCKIVNTASELNSCITQSRQKIRNKKCIVLAMSSGNFADAFASLSS